MFYGHWTEAVSDYPWVYKSCIHFQSSICFKSYMINYIVWRFCILYYMLRLLTYTSWSSQYQMLLFGTFIASKTKTSCIWLIYENQYNCQYLYMVIFISKLISICISFQFERSLVTSTSYESSFSSSHSTASDARVH